MNRMYIKLFICGFAMLIIGQTATFTPSLPEQKKMHISSWLAMNQDMWDVEVSPKAIELLKKDPKESILYALSDPPLVMPPLFMLYTSFGISAMFMAFVCFIMEKKKSNN